MNSKRPLIEKWFAVRRENLDKKPEFDNAAAFFDTFYVTEAPGEAPTDSRFGYTFEPYEGDSLKIELNMMKGKNIWFLVPRNLMNCNMTSATCTKPFQMLWSEGGNGEQEKKKTNAALTHAWADLTWRFGYIPDLWNLKVYLCSGSRVLLKK